MEFLKHIKKIIIIFILTIDIVVTLIFDFLLIFSSNNLANLDFPQQVPPQIWIKKKNNIIKCNKFKIIKILQ